MADLDKAIATAREALQNSHATANERPHWLALEAAMSDLLAALDAARGEAVAWMTAGGDVSRSKLWCDERSLGGEPSPLFAAPPAASAVPPLMDFLLWADGWRETDEHDELTGADAVAYRVAVTIHREMLAAAERKGE